MGAAPMGGLLVRLLSLFNSLSSIAFFSPLLPDSREGTSWRHIL
jgi:hypothetical protein